MANIDAVKARAAQLNCKVIGVLGNVILCHRADNTFITWRVSVGAGVGNTVDFISGCYDMAQGPANDNLIERAMGEQPAPLLSYTVWSASKAGGASTIEELRAYEVQELGAVSSDIETHDIDALIAAVYNETDIDLLYHANGEGE